jgi:hypothetical protein
MQFDFGQPRFEHVLIPIIIALLKIGFVSQKTSRRALTASALVTFEVVRLVRHRSRR